MRLYINAFKRGIQRIFSLPRLSLPLISTLGLTLAAVLSVVAISNTLLLKPLPDINENELYQVDLQMAFSEGLNVQFFSDPRRVASIKKRYGEELSWGHVIPSTANIELGGQQIEVTHFSSVTGSPEVLGLALITGLSSDVQNAEEGVWISKSLWQSALNGSEDLNGKTLRVDGEDRPVFGVFDDFASLNAVGLNNQSTQQVWRFRNFETLLETPDTISLNLGTITFVRGPETSMPTTAEIEAWFVDYVNNEITVDRAKAFLLSKTVKGQKMNYRDAFIGDSQRLAFVLMFAMFSLLIMACLNLLNMFIAHYQSRNKEFAIHICNGSTLAKLRGLIFIENLPMFIVASVLGLLVAGWLMELLPVLAGDNLPLLDYIHLDLLSIIIAMAVVLFINGVFAVIALLYVDKNALTDSLNSSGKGTPAQQNQLISKTLMVLQLTLACVLLTGASISVKDSYDAAYTDLGYSMPNAYEVSMQIIDDDWQESMREQGRFRGNEWQQVRQDFVKRLSNLDAQVLDVNVLPLTSNVSLRAFPDPDTGNSVMVRPVMWAPNLIETFDITLLAGRNLTSDKATLSEVLIAKAFAIERAGENKWESMVGKEIRMGEEEEDIFMVVGIVDDIVPLPAGTLNVTAPEIYFKNPNEIDFNRLSAVVVMPQGTELTREQAERAVKGIDPRLSEVQVEGMVQRWDTVTETTRLNMYIVAGLALLTLILAAIGVSGLSQMTANQKRYELAVRMATGAKQAHLLRLLMKDSLWMLITGLGLGVIAAVLAYRFVLEFFASAPPFDWAGTMTINVVLACVMILSIAIPGWRVVSKDPMRILREL